MKVEQAMCPSPTYALCSYFRPQQIKTKKLPALALNIDIGLKSLDSKLLDIDV